MAGRGDELPLHQTLDSVLLPASPDPTWFERSTIVGYDGDGLVVGATVALHPGRSVVDAAFALVVDGRRAVVRASGRLDPVERELTAGPISIRAVEPLHTLELTVTDPDGALGVHAGLTFTARTVAIDLPPLGPEHTDPGGVDRRAPRITPLAHRLVQAGDVSGSVVVDGTTHTFDPATHHAVRTRSWGFGPEPTPGPRQAPHHALPQTWSCDALVRIGDRAWHASIDERHDGRPRRNTSHGVAIIDPVVLDPCAGGHPLTDTGGLVASGDAVHRVHYRPGTRHLAHGELAVRPWRADPVRIAVTSTALLPARDLGLFHPVWDSGTWQGEAVVATERSSCADLDPTSVHDLGAFHVVRAETEDGAVGTGVVELLAVGPHDPSGLRGFTDGAH